MKKLIFLFCVLSVLTSVGYSQWHYQYSGVSVPLRDMEFINSTTGWVCGDDGTIMKTTNAGENWIQQPTEAVGKYLLGIHPVNENVVYCVGYFETILKTTNGGTNWITIRNGPIGEGHSYLSVFFLNENTGFVGGTLRILKTNDGGMNWSEYLGVGWIYDLFFKDSLNGIGIPSVYDYYLTTNGGENWIMHFTGSNGGDCFRINILDYDKNKGFIVSGTGKIVFKTTNFGVTFDSVGYVSNLQVDSMLYCSDFINDSIGWAGGSYGILYKTINGGRTWKAQHSLSQAFIRNIYILNDTVAWACGAGGKIIHTTNGGDTITGIRQVSTIIPTGFELFQNYPNPFNSQTIISYSVPKRSFIQLKIYDVLGKEIKEIENGMKDAGNYSLTFDASELTSGIYFIRLTSGNNFFKTRKMILIK